MPTLRLLPDGIAPALAATSDPEATITPPLKLFAPLRVSVPPPFTVSEAPTPLIPPEIVKLLPDTGATSKLLTSPIGALIVWLPPAIAMLALLAPLERYNVPPVPWPIV